METKKFQKRAEDFTCSHCGFAVVGTGYTNHCPKCLWSKHVDVNPGDRLATCGGLMEPVRVEGTTPEYKIVHQCTVCGFTRRNMVSDLDNTEVLFLLAQKTE